MDFLLDILREKNINEEEILLFQRSLLLILTLPLVATITGIFKHVIGIKTLSIYAPIVLTFAFYEMGFIEADGKSDFIRGLKFGLVLYLIVFLSSALIYKLVRSFRMHYVPKNALILTGVVSSIILSLFLGTLIFEKKGLIYLDVFSIIMIATLSETFVSSLGRKSFTNTSKLAIQTLLTAVLSYAIISLDQSRNLIINYSIILIFALLIINLYIGRFLGLRLSEYWRFKELLLQEINVKKTNKTKKKQTKSSGSK
jgi:hypothetical protein